MQTPPPYSKTPPSKTLPTDSRIFYLITEASKMQDETKQIMHHLKGLTKNRGHLPHTVVKFLVKMASNYKLKEDAKRRQRCIETEKAYLEYIGIL